MEQRLVNGNVEKRFRGGLYLYCSIKSVRLKNMKLLRFSPIRPVLRCDKVKGFIEFLFVVFWRRL